MTTTPPPLGRPTGANSDETRRRILGATMRCVAEVGAARATIREIAREAQMTSGSLYHYFPNKDELITATIEEFAELCIPRVVRAGERSADFRDRLTAVFDECDQMMRDYPLISAFDRAIRADGHPQLTESLDKMFSTLRVVLLDIVKQAQQSGALTHGLDVESAANAVFIVLRGLNDHAATSAPEDYHATVEALKRMVNGTLFA